MAIKKLNIQIKHLEQWFDKWYPIKWNNHNPSKDMKELKKIIKRMRKEVKIIAKEIRELEQKKFIQNNIVQSTNKQTTDCVLSPPPK